MSELTKLRNLLNKTKPTLQLEIRKKKPTTTKQFLEYAIEVEELFHLSNICISDDLNKTNPPSPVTSIVTPSRSKNPPTQSDKTIPQTTHPENNYDNTYKNNNHNNNHPYCYFQTFVPSHPNHQTYYRPRRPWHYPNQPFLPNQQAIHPKHNHPPSNNTFRTPYHPNYNQNNFPNNKNSNNSNYNKPPKNNNLASRAKNNSTANIPPLLDPLPPLSSFEICSRSDGIAPFHVHGVVELHIKIANQITKIKAHVAENLCTDPILGTCLGYLCQYSSTPHSNKITHHLNTPCGAANLIGDEPVLLGVSNDKTPPQDVTQLTNSIPSTVSNVHSFAENDFRKLIKHFDNKNQQNVLLALLFNFRPIFDTQRHNITKTRIHHIINTNPHSSPGSKPYPQPDKEEHMFNMIQKFLQAGLISESHSPYATPAFLVKKKDGTFRLVVDYKEIEFSNY
ncbi:unnamed protein product [Rotaria sordida]|uniref:Reverse transcriptase/retrotransposon-derived protein RNase H-like domain-containing protein n=1 Tax=Rotaria sordida TaxID=392033 RepID=A0A815RC03_9BILA|nr:unnamed protein product [Rotaria sordida]CAF1646230.1 unnamed protein product [Rotaria sordida]